MRSPCPPLPTLPVQSHSNIQAFCTISSGSTSQKKIEIAQSILGLCVCKASGDRREHLLRKRLAYLIHTLLLPMLQDRRDSLCWVSQRGDQERGIYLVPEESALHTSSPQSTLDTWGLQQMRWQKAQVHEERKSPQHHPSLVVSYRHP